ncbi:MAG: class I SAM-dependent methyltransferase [Oligoflexia bacterium]|nr:class I SAM-dependent methyltransferase [Oligoflexia bacterium]
MDLTKQGTSSSLFQKKPEYFESRRDDLIAMIPPGCKKILDVGCGAAEGWKNFKGEVSGIELNSEAAEKARKNIKEVVVGDIENTKLPFSEASFDCIVFADVLEHLYDPWGILLKFRPYLKAGGHILISIPNIRHYRILRSLIFKGEFTYQDSGILDIDHIRFFTRKEVSQMVNRTGFEIESLQRKIMASSKYSVLNSLLFGAFTDFLTGQFYVLAKKK